MAIEWKMKYRGTLSRLVFWKDNYSEIGRAVQYNTCFLFKMKWIWRIIIAYYSLNLWHYGLVPWGYSPWFHGHQWSHSLTIHLVELFLGMSRAINSHERTWRALSSVSPTGRCFVKTPEAVGCCRKWRQKQDCRWWHHAVSRGYGGQYYLVRNL